MFDAVSGADPAVVTRCPPAVLEAALGERLLPIVPEEVGVQTGRQMCPRQRLGLRRAATLYDATGDLTNSLYARLHPTSVGRAVGCAAVLGASRLWTAIGSRALPRLARPAAGIAP